MRFLTATLDEEEEEEDAGSKHHGSNLHPWQVCTFFLLAVVLILSLLTFIIKLRALRRRRSSHETDQTPSISSPTKDAEEVTTTTTSSELVFFVEEEEWFKMEELLEGVADLRTQGFSSCMYIVHLKNGAVYAVKRLRKLEVSLEEFGLAMKRVGSLRHPNILPLVCYNNNLQEKLLIYKFQPNGSLLDLLQSYGERKRAFPWRLRLSIAAGIARGLQFIHNQEEMIIPHGLIKLSNIILDQDYFPMISEYGYSRFLSTTTTMAYQKADVYSFGVILLELLSGKPISSSEIPMSTVVLDKEMSEVGMCAFPLLNLALKCVALDADDRPTFAEAVDKIEEVLIVNAAGEEDALVV